MDSLYKRIGGEGAVSAAVEIFYKKIQKDERIKHYFKNISMFRQAIKQKTFLSHAFGGKNNYSGKDMREAHKHLNLTEADFEAVIENLQETLEELKIPTEVIDEVMVIANNTHDDVLGL